MPDGPTSTERYSDGSSAPLDLSQLEQTGGINGEQYACTGGNISTSTFAVLDTRGDRDLYAAQVDEGAVRKFPEYRHVVGDNWSVWGEEESVIVAAINLGGTLRG